MAPPLAHSQRIIIMMAAEKCLTNHASTLFLCLYTLWKINSVVVSQSNLTRKSRSQTIPSLFNILHHCEDHTEVNFLFYAPPPESSWKFVLSKMRMCQKYVTRIWFNFSQLFVSTYPIVAILSPPLNLSLQVRAESYLNHKCITPNLDSHTWA